MYYHEVDAHTCICRVEVFLICIILVPKHWGGLRVNFGFGKGGAVAGHRQMGKQDAE